VDNRIPNIVNPETNNNAYFQIGSRAIGTYAKIGDVITAVYNFQADGVSLSSGTFDFSAIGGSAAEVGIISGGTISASYTLQENDVFYNPDLEISVSFVDAAGNTNIINAGIQNNSAGEQFAVDAVYPTTQAGDEDLSIINNGWLRFSPGIDDVDGLEDTPDSLALNLTLADWGNTGNIASFTIRVDEESDNNRTQVGFISFGIDDVILNGNELTFSWDGKVDGNIVTNTTETYGLTLWSIADAAGNVVEFDHHPVLYYVQSKRTILQTIKQTQERQYIRILWKVLIFHLE